MPPASSGLHPGYALAIGNSCATGRRHLAGHSNDETQYQALMDSAATHARQWNLTPGIALTAGQMAALTSDLVWLVEQTLTLADGGTTRALVPQLYVRVRDGDLQASGALIAGDSLHLDLTGDLTNTGTIAGRSVVALTADTLKNLGGRISGNDVALTARSDLTHLGGIIEGMNSLTASAGRDLNAAGTTRTQTGPQGSRTNIDRLATLHGGAGGLQLLAGRDLDLNALQATSAGGAQITAGNNLNLGTVTERASQSTAWNAANYRSDSASQEIGTTLNTTGDLDLRAGNDLTARAATATSGGTLTATAGRDLTLQAGQSTQTLDEAHQRSSKGFLSKKTTTTRDTLEQTTAQATTFSGNSVDLQAGHDLKIIGSNAVSDLGTTLGAGRDLHLEAATNTLVESHFKAEKQSGLFGSGGIGFTIGSRQQSTDSQATQTSAAAATVGSTQGNLDLHAGKTYRQTGSDLLAPQGDIDLTAQRIDIVEARETRQSRTEAKFKQSGLTLAITSPVISAIQTVSQMKDAASQTRDTRMKALAAGTAALSAKNAVDAVQAGQGTTINGKDNQMPVTNDKGEVTGSRDANAADQAGGINLSISIGASQSQSNSVQTVTTAAGSTVAAGGNINLAATGADTDSDLTIQGSNVQAGNDATLKADDEINLLAAKNTADQHSSNKNSSASIGVSLGTGGFGVTLSGSQGRGNADGSDATWSNTHLEAGNRLSLESGGDTKMKGAVASGKQVLADIGGALTLESLQDTSQYASKQQSLGGSLTLGAGASGSISASKSNTNSNYASVTEQTGLLAGDGGFQVAVKGNTDLKGGAIASTQAALDQGLNRFQSDGTLTTSDIDNRASYSAKSVGINLGSALSLDGKLAPSGTSAGFGKDSGNAGSSTKAGISGIAGDKDARTGDAQSGIQPIFDQNKVQAEINAQAAITQAFGQQASKAVGDYAQTRLTEAGALRRQAQDEADPDLKAQHLQQARQLEADWSETGTRRILAHTLVGGLTGGMQGAGGAVAGTLTAPLVADALNRAGIDGPLAGTLTALAGTAAGAAVGGTAGAGAAMNEVANNYLNHIRPGVPALSEKEGYENATTACKGGDPRACATRDALAAHSQQRDRELQSACGGGTPGLCQDKAREARSMGNLVYGRNGELVFANSPDSAFSLNVSTIGPVPANPALTEAYPSRQAGNLAQGLALAAGMGAPGALAATTTTGRMALGAGLGAGFDTAGQLYQGGVEAYRPGQTAIAATTGALAAPFAGTSVVGNALLGGVVGAGNTGMTNAIYGEEASVGRSFVTGAFFSGVGTGVAPLANKAASKLLPPFVGGNPIIPLIPILFQNFGKPNPYPGYIGFGVEQSISNLLSFLGAPEQKGVKP